MEIVYIHGLEVETIIGVYDWERDIRQKVAIDLEMSADFSAAAASDDIELALDYKAVAKRIAAFVADSRCQLMETLAVRIVELVQNEFEVQWLRLQLGKPGAVTGSRDVGVIIERGVRPAAADGEYPASGQGGQRLPSGGGARPR